MKRFAFLNKSHGGTQPNRITRRRMLEQGATLAISAVALSHRQANANPAPTDISASPVQANRSGVREAQPVSGGTLHIMLQSEPEMFDPTQVFTLAIWKAIEHIYDTMVRIDPETTPIPGLAESWEISDDGKIYTFYLRQGVVFHDGTPLTADDVRFTYTRILDPETHAINAVNFLSVKGAAAFNRGQVPALEGIRVLDPFTLEITLEEPDASFLSVLALGTSSIMSRAFVDAHNGDVSQATNGTGAFRFKEYVPGSLLSYEKNPDYWETGLPYLDTVEARFASDDSARSGSLIQGSTDFIEYAPLRDIDTLSSTNGLKIAGHELNNCRYVLINLLREPFTDLRVRQAIALAIDRAPIIEAAIFGHGIPLDTIFAPGHWAGFDHEIPAPDRAHARALLAEAGYPNGFKTTLITYSPYSFLTNAAIVVQEQLKQIGIEVDFTAYEVATTSQLMIQHEFDLAIGSATAWIDPHPLLFGNFGTGQLGNSSGYSNPRVDELIAQGKLEIDRTARAFAYRELQEIILADLPWIPLYASNQYEAMKDEVNGFVHYPNGSNASLRTTWIDRS